MPSGFKCKCDLWAWQAALDKEPPPWPLLWHLGSSACASPALEDVCTQIKCDSSHAKLHLQRASCIVQLLLTLQHCRMGVATTAAGQRFNYFQLLFSSRAQPQLGVKSLARTATHPVAPFVVPLQGRLAILLM